ncbi:hypothetical protein [Aquimarina aggregata]|uniref:hypothetical protein n=1 Tax=Aquimarina aggregata TaxID=1642818 RepID=UPI00248F66E5|nr:hypothetical protein [Aquimarina aggregata]
METLKSIFRFYINSSIHVSLAVCALVQVTLIKIGFPYDYTILFYSFFTSLVAYNFVKYSKVSKLYHKRLTKSMKSIHLLTLLACIGFVYTVFKIPFETVLYTSPFIALTILYTVPVFPNNKNLRSLAGVKIFIIGAVWAGITVLVPLVYAEENLMNFDFIVEIVQRFLFIVVMMLPFEIRDLQYDDLSLETVPQKIGVTRTKVFGSILLVLFLLLTAVKDELNSIEILSTILVTTISLLFLWGTEKKQSEYYCSFWVESVPIFWLLILFVLENLFS